MKASIIKFIQKKLRESRNDIGAIDGIAGPRTITAINEMNIVPISWPKQRKLTAYIQYLAKENSIDSGQLDGYWGPQTDYAYSELQMLEKHKNLSNWRDFMIHDPKKNVWPRQVYEELIDFYGNVGENQVTVLLPYKMKLSWNKSQIISEIQMHEKVAESCKRILQKVLDYYGLEKISELGLDILGSSFSVRKTKGGTNYSTHSWGIALDFDPENNKLAWGKEQASFAQPAYDKWWEFWEEEGWVSLGRERNFDWMHVQAAVLP